MNLTELTWPVRIYWDLPAAPKDPTRLLAVCDEFISAKVLFLILRDLSSPLSSPCRDVLDILRRRNVAHSLTVSGDALAGGLQEELAAFGALRSLLVEFSSLDGIRSFFSDRVRRGARMPLPGVSFAANADNCLDIPAVVSFCIGQGISELVFPIQQLTTGEKPWCIDGAQGSALARGLSGLDLRAVRITIHDPFLWPLFFPDAPYHEGGCQAANSMLYLSPDGIVYPCPALPLPLGDLRERTLREIVLSEGKRELRERLRSTAAECASCRASASCLGGCRGRALAATGSLDRRDPACPGGR